MKIEKILISEIKKAKGNLLAIGEINDSIIDSIENNKNILFCDILSNMSSIGTDDSKIKNTIITVEEIKKRYKRKHINYVICNFEDIKECYHIFFKDIFKIYNNKLYLITSKKSNIELDKKFSKLGIKFIKKEDKDTYLYIVDNKKIPFLKSNIMYLENKMELVGNSISDILNR